MANGYLLRGYLNDEDNMAPGNSGASIKNLWGSIGYGPDGRNRAPVNAEDRS